MKFLVFAFIFWFSIGAGSAQFSPFQQDEPSKIDTLFHPWKNDVQLIEVNHVGLWQRRVSFLEMSQPRGLSWSHVLQGERRPNEYIVRNREGSVIRAFNSLWSLEHLNSIFQNKAMNMEHNVHVVNLLRPDLEYAPKPGYFQVYDSVTLGGPFMSHTPSKSGLIDSTGSVVVPIEFDEIHLYSKAIVLKRNDTLQLIDLQLQPILPPKYNHYEVDRVTGHLQFQIKNRIHAIYDLNHTKLHYVSCDQLTWKMNGAPDGQYWVGFKYNQEQVSLIDTNFNEITGETYSYVGHYWQYGRLRVCQNKKWGLIHYPGTTLVPCEYDNLWVYEKDSIIVEKQGQFFWIDPSSQQLTPYTGRGQHIGQARARARLVGVKGRIPEIYKQVRPLSPSVYLVQTVNNQYALLDSLGDLLSHGYYDRIHLPGSQNAHYILEKHQRFGFLSANLEHFVPCEYKSIHEAGSGLLAFCKGDKWGYMDNKGTVKLPIKYDYAYRFDNGLALVRYQDKMGYIRTDGSFQIPARYSSLSMVMDGLIIAQYEDKYGVIRVDGREQVPFEFERILPYYTEMAVAKRDGKYGLINKKGKTTTKFVYDGIGQDYAGKYYQAILDGKSGVIDIKGRIVLPFDYSSILGFNGKVFRVKKDNQYLKVEPKK
ncbi:MAG: WG repeat-containing protein [Bacteroidia bacterium]|nr:WG repeat-containing protein [Bacteroidia bacterium]